MTKHFTSSKAKRYTLQGLLAVSVVGLGVAGVLTQIDSSAPAVAAQAETEEAVQGLELSVYSNAMQVRRGAGLADKDLAALGMTQVETTVVLERLVAWCEDNEKTLHQSRQAVYEAQRELSQQQRLVRIGQASQQQLTDAGGKAQAVADAEQVYAELIDSGASYAMQAPSLGADKAVAWERAAGLSGQVDSDLRYVQSMSVGRFDDLKAESKRQKTTPEQSLSYSEQQALASVRMRVISHLPGVQKAVEVVMPLPVEFQPVPEDVLLEDERLNPQE